MRKTFIAILFFSLAGLIASGIMTQMHFKLAQGGFDEKSFCNISEFVDCDTALASRYAKIGGVPTSQIGLCYYLFFFLAALYAWWSERRKGTLSFLLAAAVVSVGYSLVMVYFSLFRLHLLCLLCLTTYLANLSLVVLVPNALGVRLHKIPSYLIEYLRSIVGKEELQTSLAHLVIFVLVMGGGLLFFRGANPKPSVMDIQIPNELYLKNFYATAPLALDLQRVTSWGPADAKVTIVEFSDFQCPFCRRAAFTLKPYLGELRNRVRFIFIPYPLDNACNPAVTHAMHPVACLAAKAALCADEKGKFWEYHDLVFENQKKLSRATLLELAKKVGLDESWLNVCLIAPETEARLAEAVEEGKKFEVRGTPSLFINGRPFRDWTDPEWLRLVVESGLSAASAEPIGSPHP